MQLDILPDDSGALQIVVAQKLVLVAGREYEGPQVLKFNLLALKYIFGIVVHLVEVLGDEDLELRHQVVVEIPNNAARG